MKIIPLVLVSVTSFLVTHLQARVWTSADGSHETEAEFISVSDGSVTLQKPGGTRINFSLDKLSADDQAWVKEKLASEPSPGTTGSNVRKGAEKSNEYTKQITGKWERLEDAELKYRFFAGHKLKGSKLYPLVIYLHGRGGDVMTPNVPGPKMCGKTSVRPPVLATA